MSWTLDAATTPPALGTTNPFTTAITCASNARLLIAVLFVNGIDARTGGAPTYNGAAMTDSGQGFVFQAAGEAGVEIWYLINPSTGSSYNVSVPNTNAVSMTISAFSFIPSAGGAAYDNSASATGTTAPPTLSLTVGATGNLIIGGVGSGERDVPGAGTNFTLLHTEDAGNQVWGSEYDLAGTASPVTVAFSLARDDDWGLIGVSFAEVAGAIQVVSSEAVSVADTPAAAVSDPQVIGTAEAVSIADTPIVDVSDPQINNGLSTVVYDTFTDSDSTSLGSHSPDIGGTWTVVAGTPDIFGNQARINSGEIATIAAAADGTFSFDAVAVAAGAAPGFLFRYQDNSNFWLLKIDSFTDAFLIIQYAGGSPTTRDTASVTIDLSTTYAIVLTLSGNSITATLDGGNEVSYSSSTLATETTIGLRGFNDGCRFDNLTVSIGAALSESVTVTDSPTLEVESPAVSDLSVSASEAVTVIDFIYSYDEYIGVADSADASLPDALAVVASEAVTVADSPALSVSALGDINASASEAITVADSPTAAVSDPQVSAAEAVIVADSPAVSVQPTDTPQVTASEAVSVDDTGAADVSDPQITASEAVTVADTPQVTILVQGELYAATAEAVSVADSATVTVSDPQVSAAEAIGVADSATADVSDPQITAAEAVTVADSASLAISAQADLSIVASEAVNIADSPTAAMGDLQAVSGEAVSVADSGSAVISAVADLLVSAIENVTVADSATMGGLLIALTVVQSISVADSGTVVMPGLTLLDVALTDAVVTSLLLSDSVVTSLSLSDSVVTNLTLSDKTR